MIPLSRPQVAALGGAQTLAWASSVYLPAVLAVPMAQSLGLSATTVFACMSGALGLSALVGPWAGRHIDRAGGRRMLMGSNLLFAAGLLALASAQGLASLGAGWLLIGLAMGLGLYDTAFASLVRWEGAGARRSITAISLMAGFASTLGWPLSAAMDAWLGWRGACMGWALLHLCMGLPLNAMLPRRLPAAPPAAPAPAVAEGAPSSRQAPWLLAAAFACTTAIGSAMAAHLPGLLQAAGCASVQAVALAALVGPAQVAARLAEFGWQRHGHPLQTARGATLLHPLGAAALWLAGPVAAPAFALLHGASNGLLTISKGTLPLALFGSAGYGRRQGLLMLPGRVAGALAPWAFAFALQGLGADALLIGLGLGLLALGGLALLQAGGPSARPVRTQ